jgi:GNAT superfamily N-acetyltransferase
MTTMQVRKATAADRATVASALGSAFAEDPVLCWMSGEADCERRMAPFWRTITAIELAKADHEMFVSEDGASVALWKGIDKWKSRPGEMLRLAPAMVRSLRARGPLGLRLLTEMEKVHPTEPHYYLECLGTRRDRQGKGAGSAVIEKMLQRCDAEGVPAYLESSNPRNVPFYARHGFVETGVIEAPKGGPKLTPMWRDPR